MFDRSIRRSAVAAALGVALLVAGGGGAVDVARADTIVTSGARTRDIQNFGDPGTEMYGQTFSVGAQNVLTSFSFDLAHIGGPPPTEFNFYVMKWDQANLRATGATLYQGGTFTLIDTTYQTFTFNTGSLALTSGQSYIAFVDTVLNGTGDQAKMAGTANTYSGGEFVYLHGKGNSISAATSNPWTTNYWADTPFVLHADAKFTAVFTASPAPVPLPAAAIGGVALMGMVAAKRLRRRGVANRSAAYRG